MFGAIAAINSFICLFFDDTNEVEKVLEMGWGIAMFAILFAAAVMMANLGLVADLHVQVLREEADLSPPAIEDAACRVKNNRLEIRFDVSDAGHGESQITNVGVYLFRTPLRSDSSQQIRKKFIFFGGPLYDNITGKPYYIETDLSNIDGDEGTPDDNGLVDITQATGVKVNPVDGKLDESFEVMAGYADFGGVEIHNDCCYYMIIVAVDYWGNAYWGIYNVTEYVHGLSPDVSFLSSGGSKI